MDTMEKSIVILYRHISPERILHRISSYVDTLTGSTLWEDLEGFFYGEGSMLSGYSIDEQRLAFWQMKSITAQTAERWGIPKSVFAPLVDFGEKTLTVRGNEPLCHFTRVLPWREVYNMLGQDLVVCAYLACIDRQSNIKRRNFAWPAVLATDNNRLRQMLEEGLAENHYHLKGSAHAFSLAWCELMNDPGMMDGLSQWFPDFLHPLTVRDPADGVKPLKEWVQLAALIRTILFRALRREAFTSSPPSSSLSSPDEQQAVREPFSSRKEFSEHYNSISRHHLQSYCQGVLQGLRQAYGALIPQPNGPAVCLDYALEPLLFCEAVDFPFRIMIGERSFLYRCFTACFNQEFNCFEQNLFYLYLLLKTIFHGEMIQSNKQVGFQNFDLYQERKDFAWHGAYQWEAYRMALNGPLSNRRVTSLEARLTPAKTPQEIRDKILLYDMAKRFGDQTPSAGQRPGASDGWSGEALDADLHAKRFRDEPHFYVMHFVKQHDEEVKGSPHGLDCRHHRLRVDTRERAVALAQALSRWPYLCYRIRGIDGCANEVGCRPEVFGTAFRFLRNFHTEEFLEGHYLFPEPTPNLSITYHVGEDFYDIADGLRAIDEAVCFLDLRRGDRLGHALALGVEPPRHYQTKSMCSILPKQNYLDNLVWMIYRGRELGVWIDPQQREIMLQQANYLLREIYQGSLSEQAFTLQDYYSSMSLRGDMPELYASRQFDRSQLFGDPYSAWGTLRNYRQKDKLDSCRNDLRITRLYYAYHFDRRARKEGAKTITVDITPGYITVVRQIQDAMQWYLEQRGIVVECNPTSNVLIGTFGGYDQHPITRFNNQGLDVPGEQGRDCPQMHVCVNTDDLGVFDTSLEFEYALLMASLSEQRDENLRPLYSANSILTYLHNLQIMGRQAVFPPPK